MEAGGGGILILHFCRQRASGASPAREEHILKDSREGWHFGTHCAPRGEGRYVPAGSSCLLPRGVAWGEQRPAPSSSSWGFFSKPVIILCLPWKLPWQMSC